MGLGQFIGALPSEQTEPKLIGLIFVIATLSKGTILNTAAQTSLAKLGAQWVQSKEPHEGYIRTHTAILNPISGIVGPALSGLPQMRFRSLASPRFREIQRQHDTTLEFVRRCKYIVDLIQANYHRIPEQTY